MLHYNFKTTFGCPLVHVSIFPIENIPLECETKNGKLFSPFAGAQLLFIINSVPEIP